MEHPAAGCGGSEEAVVMCLQLKSEMTGLRDPDLLQPAETFFLPSPKCTLTQAPLRLSGLQQRDICLQLADPVRWIPTV